MADISKFNIDETTYDLKDDKARNSVINYGISGAAPVTLSAQTEGAPIFRFFVSGASKKVDNEIISLGDDGLKFTLTDTNGTNSNTVVITTGLPLRSSTAGSSVRDSIDFDKGIVTTRCYYDENDNEVKALDTPIVTRLTEAEISAYKTLRSFYPTTVVKWTDSNDNLAYNIFNSNVINISVFATGLGYSISSVMDSLQTRMDTTITQKETLPAASHELLGKIYQFVGTTTSNYTNGYFYKCVELPNGTYAWVAVNVQSNEDEDISNTVTDTSFALTDAANARIQGLKVYGRTSEGASVGDNGLVINSHGKNIFNINGEVNYYAVTTTTPPENWAIDTSSLKSTVSGTTITARKNANYYFLDGQKINVIAGETYTLSFRMLESEVAGIVRVSYWDETEQKLKHAYNWWHTGIFTTQHVTFTAPTNLILLCFGTGASTPVSFTDIQLEKGSVLTDWETYKGSTLTIATGLPLRSASESVYDELDCAAGTVTTRCEVVEGAVMPLVTPTVTPLTSTELAAWRMLRTYSNLNYIEVTDNPQITVSYLKNTDNGSAISEVVDDLQGQIGYDLAKRIEDIEAWIAEQEQGV